MVVLNVRSKDFPQRVFIEHDHVVEALTPNRTNHALDIGSLPGRARD